jgi:TIR domain
MSFPEPGVALPNLFVSWSGPRARSMAEALSQWLPGVLPTFRPWISSRQSRGTDWAAALFEQIATARATVVCVTSDSIAAPWVLFEAGLLGGREDHPLALYVLDVEDDELTSSVLGRFPAFSTTESGTSDLVRLLNGASDTQLPLETVMSYVAGSWSELEQQLSVVPATDVRPFTAFLYMADVSVPYNIELTSDVPWADVLRSLAEVVSQQFDVPPPDLSGCEYFDLDAQRWLERPRRLSSVRCRRLVLVHPTAREKWKDATQQIMVYSLDTQPRQARAWALTRRDLRDLCHEQRVHYNDAGAYAADLQTLEFYTSPDVELEIVEATQNGWCAVATHPDLRLRLGIRDGQTTMFADQPVGSPFPV